MPKASSKPKVIIYADCGEEGSGIVRLLTQMGAEVKVSKLEVADYLLSEQVGVERKTAHDFIGSIINKRLFRQMGDLKGNFERPILIVEGDPLHLEGRKIHPNAVRGALGYLAVNLAISVISTKDKEDTAGLLYMIAHQQQVGLKTGISLRGARTPQGLAAQQVNFLEGLPSIGPALARALLSHFGSLERIALATEEELIQVRLIGKVKAKRIRNLLSSQYIAPPRTDE